MSDEFIEAAGATAADEDADPTWRRITGQPNRDLLPMETWRMQELAAFLWRTNALANRAIELPLAFLLAEGVTLQVPDPEAQQWLDGFWNDPINNWPLKLERRARGLALFGELCLVAFVNEFDGAARLAAVDPGRISEVVTDPENDEQVIGVIVRSNAMGGKEHYYRAIVNGPETVFAPTTQKLRETFFSDGECFYFAINQLSSTARGHSDILTIMDWCHAYDKFLWGELDRSEGLRSFIWDVEITGADQKTVEERARTQAPPQPGAVRYHNQSEKWAAVAPDLQAVDSNQFARLFRNHALGGVSIPEHWHGGGGDVNRATAAEMADPVFKVITLRQGTIKAILTTIAEWVIFQRLKKLHNGAAPSKEPGAYRPKAVFPEMVPRDVSRYAAAMAQLVAATIPAIDKALMTEESAVAIIGIVAGQLGIRLDPKTELERARQAAETKAQADQFPGLDDDAP